MLCAGRPDGRSQLKVEPPNPILKEIGRREGNSLKVLIIGASKGVGLETTRQAVAAGHEVRAMARSAEAMPLTSLKLEKVNGDALVAAHVRAALTGVDAVIMTIGIGLGELARPIHLFSEATRVALSGMQDQSIRRLICVTGFGAGDSEQSIHCIQRVPFQLVFGRAYDDKTRQEQMIRSSGVDWTIVRPGVLTPGPRSGRYKVLRERSQWRNGLISRSNLADFLVRQLDDRSCIGAEPVLVQW